MPEPQTQTRAIEIFRAGRHVAMDGRSFDFSRADIAAIAASYDPATSEAPIVVGHPELHAPAYGWVRGLEAQGDVLVAKVDQVDPAFAELVNAGRFKKVSASLFAAGSPGNPKPEGYYLRHVGFLGATAPAVKGLRDASFAAADGVLSFGDNDRWAFRSIADVLRKMRDYFVEAKGAEAADQMAPSWLIDSIAEAGRAPEAVQSYAEPAPVRFAAPTAEEITMPQTAEQLAQRETELAERERRIAAAESERARAGYAEFAESLVARGSLLPRQKVAVVECLALLAGAQPISFADGDETKTAQPVDLLRSLLSDLPAQISFSEKSGADTLPPTVAFAAPPGVVVDPTGLEIHNRALAYARQHKVSYEQAVDAVYAAR